MTAKRALIRLLKHGLSPKFCYLRKFAVQGGDVVIDLGANVGEVSEYFLARGADVHSFEPNPYAFEILKQRASKARLYQAAVSNYNGQAKLWLHNQHNESEIVFSQSGSLQKEKQNVSEDSVGVEVIDIETILEHHPRIKLIKIDIEGGEYDIMPTILRNIDRIDYVLLETHGAKNPAFAAREAELMSAISPYKDKIFTDWF